MSGEQSKRLDALLESVTNSVSKMEVHVSPVPSCGSIIGTVSKWIWILMTCIVGSRFNWGTGHFVIF